MLKKMNRSRQMIVTVIALFVVSLNLRPAITSIGPLLDTIRDSLQLTNVQVSLLTTVPVVCMGIFASLAPLFNRVIGLYRTMLLLLFVIGIMTTFRGIITSYAMLLSSAFFIGVAIAIIGPLLSAMIKQNFPQHTASMIGVYSFGMGVGATISAGLTAFLYEKTTSISFTLSIWAVLALIGFLFWFMTMKQQSIVHIQTETIQEESSHLSGSPWKERRAWLFLLFFGLQSAAFFSIVTWLVPIATSASMPLVQAGSMLTVMTGIQLILNIGIPLLMERWPSRRNWLLFLTAVGFIAILFIGMESFTMVWIGAILLGIPLGGLFPIALLLPLDETNTASETNQWTSMMQTGGFIIGGLVPLLIGLFYDVTETHQSTLFMFLLLFASMFVLSFFIGNKKIEIKVKGK